MTVSGIAAGIADQQIFNMIPFAALLKQPQGRNDFIMHFIVKGSIIFEILNPFQPINLCGEALQGMVQRWAQAVDPVLLEQEVSGFCRLFQRGSYIRTQTSAYSAGPTCFPSFIFRAAWRTT